MKSIPIVLCSIYMLLLSCRPQSSDTHYFIRVVRGPADEFGAPAGYVNLAGDTVIAVGKYLHCYTDTLKNFAIVMKKDGELAAIDKLDQELFQVFSYDNGPDYPADGLFRIMKNGKIGYADSLGKIIIEPQFACAFPFENGRARVTLDGRVRPKDEHMEWQSEGWFYIDRQGKKLSCESFRNE